jgi:hypothetical protein
MRVAGFAFRGRAEECGDIVLSLDVRLVGEVQVAAVRLRLARERGLEVVVGLRAFQGFHLSLLVVMR